MLHLYYIVVGANTKKLLLYNTIVIVTLSKYELQLQWNLCKKVVPVQNLHSIIQKYSCYMYRKLLYERDTDLWLYLRIKKEINQYIFIA